VQAIVAAYRSQGKSAGDQMEMAMDFSGRGEA
jgi:hypothetical protein